MEEHFIRAPTVIRDARDLGWLTFPEGVREPVIDLTEVEWMSPLAVAALLSRCLMESERANLVVNLPDDRKVRTYLSRIGFYAALKAQGIDVDEDQFDLDSDYKVMACLPVTKVTTEYEVERAGIGLQEALGARNAPPMLIAAAYDVVSELTSNAREHGSPCYVLAQTHSGATSQTPGLSLAVADFGVGFRETLGNYVPSSEGEALLKAFEEGVSGTGDPHRGLGLNWVLDAVDGYPGSTLQIVSRSGWIWRTKGVFSSGEITDCQGVLAAAYFPF